MYDSKTSTPAHTIRLADAAPAALEIRVARTRAEVVRCQYLIADVYNRTYDIVFTNGPAEPQAKIEPYPHHYLMATVDGELVACVGLYVRDTYVERYGGVTGDEIREALGDDLVDRFPTFTVREVTKLVVRDGWSGRGLGRSVFVAAHSRDFLHLDGAERPLVVCCAKRSIYETMHHASRIRTRLLKPFPHYRAHARYASAADPMDSRLIVPTVDIDPRWYEMGLPVRSTLAVRA